MTVTKDFYSLMEMTRYIEENNIKSKDIYYMGNFLNVQGYCLSPVLGPHPALSLQYENHITPTTSCVE